MEAVFPPKLSKLSTNPRGVTTTVYKNIKTETLLMYVNFYYIINLLYFRAPSDCFVPSTWQNQFPIPYKATAEIIVVLKLSIPRILAVNLFVLFRLNAHNILNTNIYHILPPTYFGVCYTIFRETIALLAVKLYVFCTVFTVGCVTKCKIHPVIFLIYDAVIMFKTMCYFVLLYL
jgi:hypothetical protein